MEEANGYSPFISVHTQPAVPFLSFPMITGLPMPPCSAQMSPAGGGFATLSVKNSASILVTLLEPPTVQGTCLTAIFVLLYISCYILGDPQGQEACNTAECSKCLNGLVSVTRGKKNLSIFFL